MWCNQLKCHGIPLCVELLQGMTSVLLTLFCSCSIDLLMIFFVAPSYTDPHEHINSYSPGWLFNLSLFLGKLFFKIHPFFNVKLNPNVYISFIIFDRIFGIQGKVIVFLSLILLLLLFILLSLFQVIKYLL